MDSRDMTTEEVAAPQESGFREITAIMLRNKWTIVIIALCIMVLSTALSLVRAPVFQATTTVLINPRAGQQANPFAQRTDLAANKLQNEIAILESREITRRVAASLVASPFLDSARTSVLPLLRRTSDDATWRSIVGIDTIIDRVQNAASFVEEKESDIIKIIATGADPREAALLANTYADMYLEQVLQVSRSRSRSIREFLEGRLADQRVQLQESEGALKQYMESSGLVSLDAESDQLVHELSQLEATRNGLSVEIEGLSERLNSLQAELPQQESSVADAVSQADDPYVRGLGEQIAALEVRRDVMLAQNDPEVLAQAGNQAKLKELNDQIDALRENLRKRTSAMLRGGGVSGSAGTQADPLNNIRQLRGQILEAKIELETLRSRRSALSSIISEYEGRFRRIPRQSLDFARLQRERLSTEKLYGLVEEKYNESAITEKSEFGYVDIIDRATPGGAKPRSSLFLNTIIGFLVGLGVAVGFVFVREAIDVRIRTPEQLHRKGYPTLAEVTVLDHELKTLRFDGSLPKGARDFSPYVRLVFHPLSFTAECYRRLRTSLLRLSMDQPIKTVLVTSANPQEGKSTTLLNLAITLAETNQRVLVVDMDLRRPTDHIQFGLPRAPGFTDIVAGGKTIDSVIHRNVVPHLDVLTSGTAAHHPSEFFGHTQTLEMVMGMREQYRWILIDAPPVLVVNDALVLASLVDGTMLILSAGVTRLEALERATRLLQEAGGRLLGVVLNRFEPKVAYGSFYGSPRYGHYDNRHSYYHSMDDEHEKK